VWWSSVSIGSLITVFGYVVKFDVFVVNDPVDILGILLAFGAVAWALNGPRCGENLVHDRLVCKHSPHWPGVLDSVAALGRGQGCAKADAASGVHGLPVRASRRTVMARGRVWLRWTGSRGW
jgi:hypothetical protein